MNARLIAVKKIWGQAPHNAFSGLTRFQEQWFCVFREGEQHVSLDGNLRLISSADGQDWESAGLFKSPHLDLTDMRDGKVGIAPDGKLMVIGTAAVHGECKERQSYSWLSEDGIHWSEPVAVGEKDMWLWDFTRHNDTIYAAGYGMPGTTRAESGVRLYESEDGVNFTVTTTMRQENGAVPGGTGTVPNGTTSGRMRASETAILFHQNRGVALLRRELLDRAPGQQAATALLGTALAPYEDWTWRELEIHVGGPALIALADGRIIAGGRKPFPQSHTALWEVDLENGRLRELITLPSANDSSYPGFIWHDDLLWASYYSGHEGKTNIYLAKLEIH